MKIIIALDSFKGTLSAQEVCEIIARECCEVIPGAEIVAMPLADGGEGMVAAWNAACGGTVQIAEVSGPFGTPVRAPWLLMNGGTAVLEMASCAGLELARGYESDDRPEFGTVPQRGKISQHPSDLNPGLATTLGVGELLRIAGKMAPRIILGLGGSATNDAGCGMAHALGWRFLNRAGEDFCPTGNTLCEVERVIPPTSQILYEVVAACDVTNPLHGLNGAAHVYAPQKGADANMVQCLDEGLRHIVEVMRAEDLAQTPGAGAAGGLAFGVLAFLGGTLQPGIDLLLEQAHFHELLRGADVVITGEGRMDAQTLQGKAPMGVLRYAEAAGVPVIGICGCLGEGSELLRDAGFAAIVPSGEGGRPLQDLQKTCRSDLAQAAHKAAMHIVKSK